MTCVIASHGLEWVNHIIPNQRIDLVRKDPCGLDVLLEIAYAFNHLLSNNIVPTEICKNISESSQVFGLCPRLKYRLLMVQQHETRERAALIEQREIEERLNILNYHEEHLRSILIQQREQDLYNLRCKDLNQRLTIYETDQRSILVKEEFHQRIGWFNLQIFENRNLLENMEHYQRVQVFTKYHSHSRELLSQKYWKRSLYFMDVNERFNRYSIDRQDLMARQQILSIQEFQQRGNLLCSQLNEERDLIIWQEISQRVNILQFMEQNTRRFLVDETFANFNNLFGYQYISLMWAKIVNPEIQKRNQLLKQQEQESRLIQIMWPEAFIRSSILVQQETSQRRVHYTQNMKYIINLVEHRNRNVIQTLEATSRYYEIYAQEVQSRFILYHLNNQSIAYSQYLVGGLNITEDMHRNIIIGEEKRFRRIIHVVYNRSSLFVNESAHRKWAVVHPEQIDRLQLLDLMATQQNQVYFNQFQRESKNVLDYQQNLIRTFNVQLESRYRISIIERSSRNIIVIDQDRFARYLMGNTELLHRKHIETNQQREYGSIYHQNNVRLLNYFEKMQRDQIVGAQSQYWKIWLQELEQANRSHYQREEFNNRVNILVFQEHSFRQSLDRTEFLERQIGYTIFTISLHESYQRHKLLLDYQSNYIQNVGRLEAMLRIQILQQQLASLRDIFFQQFNNRHLLLLMNERRDRHNIERLFIITQENIDRVKYNSSRNAIILQLVQHQHKEQATLLFNSTWFPQCKQTLMLTENKLRSLIENHYWNLMARIIDNDQLQIRQIILNEQLTNWNNILNSSALQYESLKRKSIIDDYTRHLLSILFQQSLHQRSILTICRYSFLISSTQNLESNLRHAHEVNEIHHRRMITDLGTGNLQNIVRYQEIATRHCIIQKEDLERIYLLQKIGRQVIQIHALLNGLQLEEQISRNEILISEIIQHKSASILLHFGVNEFNKRKALGVIEDEEFKAIVLNHLEHKDRLQIDEERISQLSQLSQESAPSPLPDHESPLHHPIANDIMNVSSSSIDELAEPSVFTPPLQVIRKSARSSKRRKIEDKAPKPPVTPSPSPPHTDSADKSKGKRLRRKPYESEDDEPVPCEPLKPITKTTSTTSTDSDSDDDNNAPISWEDQLNSNYDNDDDDDDDRRTSSSQFRDNNNKPIFLTPPSTLDQGGESMQTPKNQPVSQVHDSCPTLRTDKSTPNTTPANHKPNIDLKNTSPKRLKMDDEADDEEQEQPKKRRKVRPRHKQWDYLKMISPLIGGLFYMMPKKKR